MNPWLNLSLEDLSMLSVPIIYMHLVFTISFSSLYPKMVTSFHIIPHRFPLHPVFTFLPIFSFTQKFYSIPRAIVNRQAFLKQSFHLFLLFYFRRDVPQKESRSNPHHPTRLRFSGVGWLWTPFLNTTWSTTFLLLRSYKYKLKQRCKRKGIFLYQKNHRKRSRTGKNVKKLHHPS